MARNIQIREPGNNYADVLHPETNSGMVLMANGKTLQNDLDTHKADYASHKADYASHKADYVAKIGKIKIIEFTPHSGTIDLNTLTEPCLYKFSGSVSVINGPYEAMRDQTMLVTGGALSFQITISALDNGEIAYRSSYWSGVFGPWYKITETIDKTATLDTAWSGTSAPYTKTVTVNGIQSSDTPIIDVVMSGTYSTDIARAEAWGYIYRAVTGANSITFYAIDKPTVNLPIQIRTVR